MRRPISALVMPARNASSEPYQPRPYSRDDDFVTSRRPPRPAYPVFFTGKIPLVTEMNSLAQLLKTTQSELRESHLFPLPKTLSLPPPPPIRWKARQEMTDIFGEVIRHGQHKRMGEMLSELYRAGYLARLGGNSELASRISVALRKFSKSEVKMERDNKKEVGLDSLGRANGSGRRKTATARVWLVPSRSAAPFIDGPAQAEGKNVERAEPLPFGGVLVNQLPMAKYFGKVQDRAAVLRPLRLAGLLGAYNIHALVQGGGSSGQSQAVALALARAIVITRPETKDVLYAGESCRFIMRSSTDDRWCDDEESEDGREEEDQLAQGQKSGTWRMLPMGRC